MDLIQCGRRLAGLGHKPSKLAITGSNPVDRTKTVTHTLTTTTIFSGSNSDARTWVYTHDERARDLAREEKKEK